MLPDTTTTLSYFDHKVEARDLADVATALAGRDPASKILALLALDHHDQARRHAAAVLDALVSEPDPVAAVARHCTTATIVGADGCELDGVDRVPALWTVENDRAVADVWFTLTATTPKRFSCALLYRDTPVVTASCVRYDDDLEFLTSLVVNRHIFDVQAADHADRTST